MTAASSLPRCTPESQGVSSQALLRLLDAWESQGLELHSFLILRRGQVLAEGWWEPYRAETPHMLYSLTKSVTATAIGLALAEGRLTLDTPVLSFFPKEAPSQPGKHLQAMRVRHLLSMTTGHATDPKTASTHNLALDFLRSPVEVAPGTHFVYNNGASDMLSAIVQKVTGQRLQEYLTPRLFTPLGITDMTWEIDVYGIDRGFRGLKLKTEDIARFGLLYLQQGVWNGMPLLLPYWVHEATSCQIPFRNQPDNAWHQGYGFQFWCGPQGIFMGAGAFGQYCIVVPQRQMVIALTAGVVDPQPLLNLLRDHLLPALSSSSLPADPPAQAALHARLASLMLRLPEGTSSSPIAPTISGRRFLLVSNSLGYRTIRFDFLAADFCRIHLVNARGEHLLVGRMDGRWQRTRTRLNGDQPEDIALQSAWTRTDTFTFRLYSLESPCCTTLTCRFDQELLRLHYKRNVGCPAAFSTEMVGWRMEPQRHK
jgi:CubicO group peptidase (beta-lactamase class C family)